MELQEDATHLHLQFQPKTKLRYPFNIVPFPYIRTLEVSCSRESNSNLFRSFYNLQHRKSYTINFKRGKTKVISANILIYFQSYIPLPI